MSNTRVYRPFYTSDTLNLLTHVVLQHQLVTETLSVGKVYGDRCVAEVTTKYKPNKHTCIHTRVLSSRWWWIVWMSIVCWVAGGVALVRPVTGVYAREVWHEASWMLKDCSYRNVWVETVEYMKRPLVSIL